MRIRSFQDGDAPALAEIFFAAVHEIASAHYSRQQVDAWAPELPAAEAFRARASDGRTLLVAVSDGDRPVAYGDCKRDGHIDHLFCLPQHSRTGVTAALYSELERWAAGAGIRRLYVEASEPARRFFLKRGFELHSRTDFVLNGVAIHNYSMSKNLPAP